MGLWASCSRESERIEADVARETGVAKDRIRLSGAPESGRGSSEPLISSASARFCHVLVTVVSVASVLSRFGLGIVLLGRPFRCLAFVSVLSRLTGCVSLFSRCCLDVVSVLWKPIVDTLRKPLAEAHRGNTLWKHTVGTHCGNTVWKNLV